MYIQPWEWGAGGDVLCHIGTKTSGRYPRGSGERPWQHEPGRAHARVSEKKALSKESSDFKKSSRNKSGSYVYEPLVKRLIRGSSGPKPRLRALTKKEIEERAKHEEKIKKEAFEKEAARRKEISEKLAKETEEQISKAIASGDRKEILKLFDKMTTAELRVATDRVRLKEDLSRVPENQIYKGKATLYKAVDILNKTSSGFKAAADIRKSVNTLLGINNDNGGKKGNKNKKQDQNKNQDNKQDQNKNQDKGNKQDQNKNQDKKHYPNLDKLGKAVSEVANGVADHPGETKRVLERLENQIKQQQERLNKKKGKKGGN